MFISRSLVTGMAALFLGSTSGCGADAPEPIGSTTSALSACPAPGYEQVVIYKDAYFSGPCVTLGIGDYPNILNILPGSTPSDFSDPSNTVLADTISSVWVGWGARAVMYSGYSLQDEYGSWEGGYASNTNFGGAPEPYSIRVESNNGHPLAGWFKGDYPKDRENFWTYSASDGPQGLAHDSGNWFLTRTTKIFKVPLTADLAANNPATITVSLPDPSWTQDRINWVNNAGYNHYGDPDVYGNYLYVPVESKYGFNKPALFIFRTSDMALMTITLLNHAKSDGSYHSAWVAVDSQGFLYTANHNVGSAGSSSGGLDVYRVSGTTLGAFQREIPLYERNGSTLVDLRTMQGGDFSADERVIYLSNSDGSAGLRAFELNATKTSGILKARSSSFGTFNYAIGTLQEAEGIDYLDVSGLGAGTHLPASQLHVLLFSNLTDAYWLKHYSVRTGTILSNGKPTSQSGTYGGAVSARAVDGNIDGNYYNGSVSHTAQVDYPQWQVDLGSTKNIDVIDVWNRTDCCSNRLREWSVWLSNDGAGWYQIFNDSRASGAVAGVTEIYPSMGPYNGFNAGVTNAFPWTGRYVLLQINRFEALHLAEVQVWGF